MRAESSIAVERDDTKESNERSQVFQSVLYRGPLKYFGVSTPSSTHKPKQKDNLVRVWKPCCSRKMSHGS